MQSNLSILLQKDNPVYKTMTYGYKNEIIE